MKNPLIIFLIIISSGFSLIQKSGYNIKDNDNFVIKQNNHYRNPDFKYMVDKDGFDNLGPVFTDTHISDKDIKTIADLKKYYPFGSNAVFDMYWDKTIDLKNAKFALAVFKNGIKMPVIITSNKVVFSFLIEDEILTIDYKTILEKDGKKEAVFGTVEIEKVVK